MLMFHSKIEARPDGSFEASYAVEEAGNIEPEPRWTTKTFADVKTAVTWFEAIAAENSLLHTAIYSDDGNLDHAAMYARADEAFKTIQSGVGQLLTMAQSQKVLYLASRLDGALSTLLEQKMAPLSKKVHERLFKGYAPLNSFAAKIDLCYALKVIDEDAYSELSIIKSIRNAFAHPEGVPSFDSDDIQRMCRHFKNFRSSDTDYLSAFVQSAQNVQRLLNLLGPGRS